MKILAIGDHKDFVTNIIKLCSILQPFCDVIHQIESDSAPIADMVEEIKCITDISNLAISKLDDKSKKAIKKLIDPYIADCMSPSALLANILGPNYRG